MGSSLILQGGAAVAKTLKESVTQTGHGFTIGDVIRWDGAQVPPKYVKAIADTAQNAEVAGVVSSTPDSNEFEVTYHGYIDLPSLSGISAPVMFLSGSAGGSLAASPPSAVGTVVKPVLTKNSNGSGYLVMNYLGTQIGGSSTIAVDEIQPVGTIMPYAGTAIPDTWLACDGNSYAMSAYPELYSKLCYTTNARTPMYGYVVEITLSSGSGTIWNNIQVGDALITNSTSTAPTPASYEIIGRVISKTASLSGSYPLTVRIFPNYSSANKNFVYPDKIPLSNTGAVKAYSAGNPTGTTDPYYGVANGTDRGTGTINEVKLIAFNAPDLRGRVGVGIAPSYLGEWESDPLISSISGNYPPGSFGGEESHILTTAEMPAHSHTYNERTTNTSFGLVAGTGNNGIVTSSTSSVGSNTPHNNMPPYLAVRYIIKAKPYTRAAIIDGIDLPYNSLLVRDLRSRNVGGSNGDLVFHTNTSGDGGNGTERMRLTQNGLRIVQEDGYTCGIEIIGAGSNPGTPTTTATAPFLKFYNPETSENRYTWLSPRDNYALAIEVSHDSTGGGSAPYNSGGVGRTGCFYITQFGDVGVMTGSPGATLDVNGTLKVGNFGGSTNVLAKLNNSVPTANTPSVGCVVPLHAIASGSATNTIPLPAGTWFVYLTGTENSTGADEDTQVVMAKVWTVASSNFLRFKPTAALTTTNTGISYSDSTSSAVDGSGTFTAIPLTDSYAAGSAAFSTVFAAGTHKGLAHSVSNSGIDLISGFAIRIA